MSNPIADTADYFARWKQISQHLQDQHDDELHQANLDTTNSRNMIPLNDQSNISDTRSQWLRVLNRISFLNPIETSQVEGEHDLSDDDSVMIDRDTFELMRSAAKQQYPQQKPMMASRHQSVMSQSAASRHHSLNVSTSPGGAIRGRDEYDQQEEQILEEEEEEEKLPSADDLENDQIYPLSQVEDEESNYFTHPFKTDTRFEQPTTPTTLHRIITEEQDSSRGKDKWDRTIDKLKLIANLQSSNTVQTTSVPTVITGPSHTLATYYPPAFDPIFAAFAKDEYGRKLVNISFLLIFMCVT